MGKSLADAMNAQPGPDSLAYWLAPFKGYFDRQGQMAQGGLDQAEQGAQDFRNNLSPMGLANMLMGPANYLASPITALLPTEAETYAARDLPEWFKPGAAAGIGTMMAVMPGPKFKGLGKGLDALAEGATDAERAALAARLETEAAQTGGQAVATPRDQALRNLTEAPEGIVAYHGSPHTFDKFDMSKIGTGEGAQAYGHGLYFAESPGVAQSYRDQLAPRANISLDAKDANLSDVWSIARDEMNLGHAKTAARTMMDRLGKSSTLAEYEAKLAEVNVPELEKVFPKAANEFKDEIALYKSIKERLAVDRPNKGSMYQVRINAKPEEFLDWDGTWGKQSKPVQAALETLGMGGRKLDTGEQFVRGIGDKHMADNKVFGNVAEYQARIEATNKLKAAGIKGIRYKDAGSRSGEGGTYNYVVFDDKIIDILKRYGIPMTAGVGGAMVVSGQNMPPALASQMGPQG